MATAKEPPRNEKTLEGLKLDVMMAIQFGYLDLLELVKERLHGGTFDFNFDRHLTKQDQGQKIKYKSFTPLLYACKCNQTHIVKWLLKLPKISKSCKTELKETALILASHNDNDDTTMELITELLKNGDQNLGSRDKHKLTALHVACHKGNVELAERLLRCNNAWISKGLRPPKTIDRKELRDMHGNTPFMMAVQNKHMEVVEMWLELEKEPSMILRPVCEDKNKKGHNAVMMAIQSGQLDCLEKMAECNAISNEIGRAKTKCGWNAFHCAAASGHLDIFKWLLSLNESAFKIHELLDGKTEKGYTPFLLACEYHHFEIVEHLVELGKAEKDLIEIDEKTKTGMTALHLAAKHDAVEIVDLLLRNGDIDVFEVDEDGNTVLHIASKKSSTKVEEKLKEYLEQDEYKDLQEVENEEGLTAEDVRDSIHIPLEIKKRGTASIEAYRNALSKGKTRINQCNLIVLGEARVGKTSLIRSILNMEFEPECESTQGVQLDDIEFAESVDISISDSLQENEMGKQVKPMERVDERIADIVVDEVNKVAPSRPDQEQDTFKGYFNFKPKSALKRSIIGKITTLNKQYNRDTGRQQREPNKRQYHQSPEDSSSTSSFQPPKATSTPTKPVPAAASTSITQSIVPTSTEKREPKTEPRKPKQVTKNHDDVDGQPDLSVLEAASGPQDKTLVRGRRDSSLSYADSCKIRKKLKSKKQQTDQDLTFHTMDFAGQDFYRPMHHCFITNRAIYLVVFKLTEILKQIKSDSSTITAENPISEIRYWLNNIIAHAASAEGSATECPRIFLVGTFKNGDPKATPPVPCLTPEDLQMVNQRLMQVFVDDLKEKRYESSIQLPNKEEVVFYLENSVSKNDRTNSGIVPLIRKIRQLRDKIPFLAKDSPTSYLQFEKKVLQMKEKRKDMPMITTRKEVEGWAREAGIEDDAGINTAIQFYHDIRVIVDQTLVSNPFKVHQRPTSVDSSNSTVLLSPQCLATVMTAVVKLRLDEDSNASISASMMKIVNHYGIIEHGSLASYLFSKLINPEAKDPQSHQPIANVLEILEAYCLIYKLSDLHHKLLGLPPSESKNDHYLIPMKLPPYKAKQEKLLLHSSGYKFEFDFQSYLPTEVYIHTICFFLSTLESEHGTDMADCVVLTDSCSLFKFVQLDNLPKAHWIIKLDQNLHKLQFEIVPVVEEIVELPCQFIKAVAERILASVCVNGSLGYFKYRGGVMDKCSKTGKDVLVPYVTFESGSSFKEKPYCPGCDGGECKDINQILAKMQVIKPQDANIPSHSDKTVCATSIDPLKIYIEHEADLITLLSSSPLELANLLCSKSLVGRKAKEDAMISGISVYEKSTRVFHHFHCSLDASKDKKAVLKQFCDALEHSFETTEPLVTEIKRKLENCRESIL